MFFQKAKELGFDQFTAEEEAQLQQDAQATLDTEIENWITNNAGLAEDATDCGQGYRAGKRHCMPWRLRATPWRH